MKPGAQSLWVLFSTKAIISLLDIPDAADSATVDRKIYSNMPTTLVVAYTTYSGEPDTLFCSLIPQSNVLPYTAPLYLSAFFHMIATFQPNRVTTCSKIA